MSTTPRLSPDLVTSLLQMATREDRTCDLHGTCTCGDERVECELHGYDTTHDECTARRLLAHLVALARDHLDLYAEVLVLRQRLARTEAALHLARVERAAANESLAKALEALGHGGSR